MTATGRHRYYQLASLAVARALESLMALAVEGPPRHRPKARCDDAMARARTCYDHLAGKVGVALADALVERSHVVLTEGGGRVTDAGRIFFDELGVDLTPRRNSRRAFCRPCVDWSERRWHIGGAVGAAIATCCFELGWTARRPEGRALTITPAGADAFEDLFGIRV